MVKVEDAVEIARPPADVFEFVTDPARFREWQATVVEVEPADGDRGVGARLRDVREFMGRRASSILEVTQFEPPTAYTLRVLEGAVRYEIQHRLEPVGDGTRLTICARGKPPGLLGFAARPLVRAAKRQLRADLQALKSVLER